MRKKLVLFILIMLISNLLSVRIFASDIVQINYLIDNGRLLDGKQVAIQGEAIGETMLRGEYNWVNIKDETNAIGIWMKHSDSEKITFYGNYKQTGDSIKITGIFNKACVEHGGESDIHCETINLVNKGFPVITKVSSNKVALSIILLSVLLVTGFIIYYFVIRKKT